MRLKSHINQLYSNIFVNYQRCYKHTQAVRKVHLSVPLLEKKLDWSKLYTEDETKKILRHFNRPNSRDLFLDKYISEFRAKDIIRYRTQHGAFKSLSDILNVDGIGELTLKRICNQIKTPHTSPGNNNTFYPLLSDEELAKIELIVGFDMDMSALTWAVLDRNLNLREWDRMELFGNSTITHNEFIKKVEEMKTRLPVADVYILEKASIRPSASQMSKIMHRTTVETMLVTILLTLGKKVIRCRTTALGRMFGLNVDSERVSGITNVQQMMQGTSEHKCYFPSFLIESFHHSSREFQNSASNSLLLTLTYHSLMLTDMSNVENGENFESREMSYQDAFKPNKISSSDASTQATFQSNRAPQREAFQPHRSDRSPVSYASTKSTEELGDHSVEILSDKKGKKKELQRLVGTVEG